MRTYWTCFVFSHEPNPNQLHVTHKYLGEISELDARIVEQLIDNYFSREAPLRPFRAVFNRVERFGEKNGIRVLLEAQTDGVSYSPFLWFDELRQRLDHYRKDDWPFHPHVTTDFLDEVEGSICAYALLRDDMVLRQWQAEPLSHRFQNSKRIELKAIREDTKGAEHVARRIQKILREQLYSPLLSILNAKQSQLKFTNAKSEKLLEAIASGRVTYDKGVFRGKFSAAVSRELRAIGGEWNGGVFYVRKGALPPEVLESIEVSQSKFDKQLERVDAQLRKILPAKIAEGIKSKDIFDKALWKVDNDIQKTLERITVSPRLTKEQRSKIAEDWQNNLDLYIKDFTNGEILKLRKSIQDNAFKGNRYEGVIEAIKDSYGVSARKAKFLARQETNLLLAKFKETRYKSAGVNEYVWRCVAGSKNHPVRPSHKVLEGKVFNWDNPPVTTAPGEAQRRNNPGQDFNCRCFAKPVVHFKRSD